MVAKTWGKIDRVYFTLVAYGRRGDFYIPMNLIAYGPRQLLQLQAHLGVVASPPGTGREEGNRRLMMLAFQLHLMAFGSQVMATQEMVGPDRSRDQGKAEVE